MDDRQLDSAFDLISQHVIMVIADYLQRECTAISLGSRLVEDLGTDSLEILEITLSLNEHFDVDIPESALAYVRTVGDVCHLVKVVRQ